MAATASKATRPSGHTEVRNEAHEHRWANPATDEFGVKNAEGKLDDPRQKATQTNRPEGPLPSDWAKYKGIYLDGNKTILHYNGWRCGHSRAAEF